MGAWGDLPWENDKGHDTVIDLLYGPMTSARQLLQERLAIDSSELDAGQTDTVRVCCDLIVRLAPYWDAGHIREDVEMAIKIMERVIVVLEKQCIDTVYDKRMLEALREMVPPPHRPKGMGAAPSRRRSPGAISIT